MSGGGRRIPEASGSDAATQVVQLARSLTHLRLLDLRGRVSVRIGDGILVTPRPGGGAPPPGLLTTDDLVELGPDGSVRTGRWAPPPEVALDLALYRRRPSAGAIVAAQPRAVLALTAAGRDLLPVTHTESALLHRSLPRIDVGAPILDAAGAERVVDALGDAQVAILVADGTLAVGRIPAEAAMLTQQLELLAESSALAIEFSAPGEPKLVPAVDAERIFAQKAPPDDFMGYFADVATHRPPGTPAPDMDDSEEGIRRRIVVACRLLQHHGLIEHLEHVSVRIGDGSTFLITPRGHLGRLATGDIATVDMEGRWVAGPLEPPPFLHFHRDIFLARPDVTAIVHTHQPHARALAVAGGTPLRPLHRSGAAQLLGEEPVYDVPDLMFDPDHRRPAMALLGDAATMHERSHGVDFLSDTVEAATAHALAYEDHARMHLAARRVGVPTTIDEGFVRAAGRIDPAPTDWWRHHLAELPAPD
ncbi:MAG TPA: class II aldolase/adducin family protein [Candidatus Limnocylindria bacterium]|nr:class II aldolase/adducin family protein [Candidatus Limnocylindria bacterium]